MASPDAQKMYEIAALQLFDGSFSLDQSFCSKVGVNLQTANDVCRKGGWSPPAFATTIALAYFNNRLQSVKNDWELIADKSKIWLIEKHAAQADAMFDAASKLVP